MNLQRTIKAYKFGIANYLNAFELQERLSGERKVVNIQDAILSLQRPPTYTLGKRRTDHNLLVTQSELKPREQNFITQKEGVISVTFHGPRQAIHYPIISLRAIGFGARKYVEGLESIMIEVASLYGVNAHPGKAGETGVWVGSRKIGAICVRISSGITSHGLAFNNDPDSNYFNHIVPCGIPDIGVTSLRRETQMQLPADEVIHDQLIPSFANIFHFKDIQWSQGGSTLPADEIK